MVILVMNTVEMEDFGRTVSVVRVLEACGNLFDLGPDGLGFIISQHEPPVTYAFCISRLKDFAASSFEAAGLREGDAVQFHLNAQRQVESIRRVS